jgi:general secretion pathway protein G
VQRVFTPLARAWTGANRVALCRRGSRGFTIIELVVVLVVLSVLALSVLPVAELSVRRAKERELKAALVEIRDALDAYKRAADDKKIVPGGPQSGYPPTLQTLVAGASAADGGAARLYFLRRIPRDPFAAATTAPEDTWGLRSYASAPDRPAPGADVYDVYSLTPGEGLNGVAYRQW